MPTCKFGKIKFAEQRIDVRYVPLKDRIYADMDNERLLNNLVLLSKDGNVKKFDASVAGVNEGDYVYLYMDIDEDADTNDADRYVVSEGIVVKNPISYDVCKFCCVLNEEILRRGEYVKIFEMKIYKHDRR
ncbi:MAG: hypothetical protein LUC34_07365 [Campylobacter sp.]|nr:hypothetical protein [Campylobacter sp.]